MCGADNACVKSINLNSFMVQSLVVPVLSMSQNDVVVKLYVDCRCPWCCNILK